MWTLQATHPSSAFRLAAPPTARLAPRSLHLPTSDHGRPSPLGWGRIETLAQCLAAQPSNKRCLKYPQSSRRRKKLDRAHVLRAQRCCGRRGASPESRSFPLHVHLIRRCPARPGSMVQCGPRGPPPFPLRPSKSAFVRPHGSLAPGQPTCPFILESLVQNPNMPH